MHKSQLQANFTTRYCGCQGKGSLRPLGCQFFPEIFILRKLLKIRLPTAHDLSALQRIRSFYGVFVICQQEYIQRKVIDIAKERIFDPGRSISEIAYSLGFRYPQHFTRLFKKVVGCSPNEYRTAN